MNEKITKVICKKYLRTGGDTIYAEYKENTQYKFVLETDDVYGYDIPYIYKYIYIFSEHGGYRFHLDRNISDTSKIYFLNFYDYFYDNKEIRKLKLIKIDKNYKWEYFAQKVIMDS